MIAKSLILISSGLLPSKRSCRSTARWNALRLYRKSGIVIALSNESRPAFCGACILFY